MCTGYYYLYKLGKLNHIFGKILSLFTKSIHHNISVNINLLHYNNKSLKRSWGI